MLPLVTAAAALAASSRAAAPAPPDCPLFLRRSQVRGGGTGVFAGAAIPQDSFIESCPSIAIPRASAAACALTNYCYAHNTTHDTVVLGLGMMWNHHPEPHVHNVWAGVGTVGRLEPQEDDGVHCDERYPLCDTAFFATGREAAQGEEIYGYYGGGRSWFSSRGIRLVEPNPAEGGSSAEAANPGTDAAPDPEIGSGIDSGVVPGCGGSDIAIREWGAYSTKSYGAGDLVEVSPGLVLNAEGYTATDLEPLVLPLFDAYGGGRHGLLLLGKGALYPLSRGREESTGRAVWHSAKGGVWPVGGGANLEASWCKYTRSPTPTLRVVSGPVLN